jgi:hypothetical protein
MHIYAGQEDGCMATCMGACHMRRTPNRSCTRCRFSGAQQISPAGFKGGHAASLATPEAASFGDVDAELAQHLRRLSKRDPTTKAKALQVEASLLASHICFNLLPMHGMPAAF